MFPIAPSHPQLMSGLTQPTLSTCLFFGVHPIAIHFGPHRSVLMAGPHKPLTTGDHAAPDAPIIGAVLDVYGR